jgi:hypothetical protein
MKKYKIFIPVLLILLVSISCRDHSRHIPELTINESENIITNWVTISNPEYGDTWQPGSTHLINWKTNTEIESINIDLYKKGAKMYNLALAIANTGEFLWAIPTDIIRSNHYKVRISNFRNGEHEGYSEVFYIKE